MAWLATTADECACVRVCMCACLRVCVSACVRVVLFVNTRVLLECIYARVYIFTLLALTQSFGSSVHSFITLCVKEYFLMSNLHCSLSNAALCPLVLLPF